MKNDAELSPVARLILAIRGLFVVGWDSSAEVISTIEEQWFVKTGESLLDSMSFDSGLTNDTPFDFNRSGRLAFLLTPPLQREAQIFS